MFLTRWNIPLLCKFFSASLTNLSYRLIALRIIKLQFFTVSYQLMERNIKLLLIPQLCRFKPVNDIVFLISNSYSKEKKNRWILILMIFFYIEKCISFQWSSLIHWSCIITRLSCVKIVITSKNDTPLWRAAGMEKAFAWKINKKRRFTYFWTLLH